MENEKSGVVNKIFKDWPRNPAAVIEQLGDVADTLKRTNKELDKARIEQEAYKIIMKSGMENALLKVLENSDAKQ